MAGDAPADALRTRLRDDLRGALKAKRGDEATALRVLIGAIDNAESVELGPGRASRGASEHVAGSVAGLGGGDVSRRQLSESDLQRLIAREVSELREQAAVFEAHGRSEAAARLLREAEVVDRYRREDGG